MLWLLSGPMEFTCWIYFAVYSVLCAVESLFCFISFLYIDSYVLGDDAQICKVSFMQTKHLCVLIHI